MTILFSSINCSPNRLFLWQTQRCLFSSGFVFQLKVIPVRHFSALKIRNMIPAQFFFFCGIMFEYAAAANETVQNQTCPVVQNSDIASKSGTSTQNSTEFICKIDGYRQTLMYSFIINSADKACLVCQCGFWRSLWRNNECSSGILDVKFGGVK